MDNETDADNDFELVKQTLSKGVLLNKVPIHKRLIPDGKKAPKKVRKEYIPEHQECLYTDEDSNEVECLEEPKERVTLRERAVGGFNADKDDDASKNPLNVSTISGPPYVCGICEQWFYIGAKLKVHYVLNHKRFHCEICSNLFDTQEEKQTHLSKIHSTLFCEICQEFIPNVASLLDHYETEHNSKTCTFCGILIQPKSMYESHIVRKHLVNPKYLEKSSPRYIDISKGTDFFCALCDRNRDIEVFFGHMHTHHKVNVTSLINTMVNENVMVKVEGVDKNKRMNPGLSEMESTPIQPARPGQHSCKVCNIRYSKKLPSAFHFAYCQARLLCRYCDRNFKNATLHDKHINKTHFKFQCALGCISTAYNSEENLNKHYTKIHEQVPCRYCDILISLPTESLQEHLCQKHKYKAVVMKNFKDTLFEVTDENDEHIVVCCLCDENITKWVDNVKDMFAHYKNIHSVSLKRILRMVTAKPVLKDYEDFYREIDESITKESDEETDEADEKGDEDSITPTENSTKIHTENSTKIYTENSTKIPAENSTKIPAENSTPIPAESSSKVKPIVEPIPKIKIKIEPEDDQSDQELKPGFIPYLNTEIKTDFDPDDAEALIHFNPNDEITHQNGVCDICNQDFNTIFDLLHHLNEAHKLKSQFKGIECKYCIESVLNENAYAKHLLVHKEKQKHVPIEMFNCNCDTKVIINLAHSHLMQMHLAELDRYDVQVYGLKCRFCELKMWDQNQLNQHEIICHFQGHEMAFIKCFMCLTPFSYQNCLNAHSQHFHPDIPAYSNLIYKCLRCVTVYPNIELIREHFNLFHPESKVYRCPLPNCTKACKHPRYLVRHVRAPHNDKPKPVVKLEPCDICGKISKSIRSASLHKLMKHDGNRSGFQCKFCSLKFRSNEERKLHYATAHPGQLAYTCDECGKGFVSKSGLYGHRKMHQAKTIHSCPYCNKEFSRRDSFNEHLLIHIGPKHQCPHCPKSFTQRSNLTRHVRLHTGIKPYQCIFCEKRFSDQGACRSHERVHTKEEHCECSYCGKKFTKRQKLKYHIKFHTGEGLLDCEVCGKQFSNTYALGEHRRIHNQETLVMCNCGRGFTSAKYLQRHIENVHNRGNAKFTCPICYKPLVHRSAYKEHIMTHTNIKHIKCLLCNKQYNTRKTVRRHLQEIHKLTPSDDFNKHIYQLEPEDVGLSVPEIRRFRMSVNDLLEDRNMIKIDISQIQPMNSTSNSTTNTNSDDTNLTKVNDLPPSASASVNQVADENGGMITIKEEPVSEDDNYDDNLGKRTKRKIAKPMKYKPNIEDDDEEQECSKTFDVNELYDDYSDDDEDDDDSDGTI